MGEVKLTRQGVRDLGGGRAPRQRVVAQCQHVWEREIDWDCSSLDMEPRLAEYLRCGLCQETRP